MILYGSYLKKFEKLSDEQFGRLIRLGLNYSLTDELPEIDDLFISLAFDVIKVEIDTNTQKYEETCEKRRLAGKKGGLAKASNAKQNVANLANAKDVTDSLANASNAKQNVANLAKLSKSSINDNDNENDNDNKKITLSSERVTEKASTASTASEAIFLAPTLKEIQEYGSKRNAAVDPEVFFDYYQARQWEGIKDWKAQFRVWEKREKPKESKQPQEGVIQKSLFKQFAQRDYDFGALETALVNKSG